VRRCTRWLRRSKRWRTRRRRRSCHHGCQRQSHHGKAHGSSGRAASARALPQPHSSCPPHNPSHRLATASVDRCPDEKTQQKKSHRCCWLAKARARHRRRRHWHRHCRATATPWRRRSPAWLLRLPAGAATSLARRSALAGTADGTGDSWRCAERNPPAHRQISERPGSVQFPLLSHSPLPLPDPCVPVPVPAEPFRLSAAAATDQTSTRAGAWGRKAKGEGKGKGTRQGATEATGNETHAGMLGRARHWRGSRPP